jgi:hypothetical protein
MQGIGASLSGLAAGVIVDPWYQGILQGILRFWGLETRFSTKKPLRYSHFEQFPTQIIRENIFGIREFLNGIRELQKNVKMLRTYRRLARAI